MNDNRQKWGGAPVYLALLLYAMLLLALILLAEYE